MICVRRRTKSEQTMNSAIAHSTITSEGNQKGIALIIALVMLSLLAILGVWALGSSSTDLNIAGNLRNGEIAFYTADGGIGYAETSQILTPRIPTDPKVQPLPAPWTSGPVVLSPTQTYSVTIQYEGCGQLPANDASPDSGEVDEDSPCGFKKYGLYFNIKSTGQTVNNSLADIEAYAALAKTGY